MYVYMSKQVDFTILYEGELVKSHTMDVKELAPSLISFADFLEESFKNLYGDDKNLKVQFKANKEGSLGVELIVITDLIKNFTTFFNSAEVTALLNFLGIVGVIGGGGTSLIKAIKFLKRRKIKRVISRDQGPNVEIEAEDGERLTVKREVPKLLQSISIRKKISDFLEPLKKKGIESVQFLSDKKEVQESIVKDEVDYFETPELDDEELIEETRKAAFTINSLSFKEDNKWRLSDGTNNYLVTILDKKFLNDVQNNRTFFAKDDVLVVNLRTKQFKTKNGLKTEYEILDVLDHQNSTPQLNFPFDDE